MGEGGGDSILRKIERMKKIILHSEDADTSTLLTNAWMSNVCLYVYAHKLITLSLIKTLSYKISMIHSMKCS